MPTRYVLDASAGVDILERTPEGQAVAATVRSVADIELWTVEHFHVEVAKVFRRDVRHGLLDDGQATQLVAALAEWPLQVVSVAPPSRKLGGFVTTSRFTTPCTWCSPGTFPMRGW